MFIWSEHIKCHQDHMRFFVQLVSIPDGGSPVWEDGPNRGFTLSIPPGGDFHGPGDSVLRGGHDGFLVALHWGLPTAATEAIHFPVISSTDASPSLALKDGALHQLPVCSFDVPGKPLKVGESLVLCGDIPELGSWDPSKGLQLEWREGDSWAGQIRLPSYAAFNAKVGSLFMRQIYLNILYHNYQPPFAVGSLRGRRKLL